MILYCHQSLDNKDLTTLEKMWSNVAIDSYLVGLMLQK